MAGNCARFGRTMMGVQVGGVTNVCCTPSREKEEAQNKPPNTVLKPEVETNALDAR